jgi:L-fuculose-phosphate aldolase
VTGRTWRDMVADELVRVCRRLYERGLIAGPDGNVSVRIADDAVLVTPSGLSKVDVTPVDLVVVDLEGEVVTGSRPPSSELRMHLQIYETRPDVKAVVHAHPPMATALAVAGLDLMAPVLPEVILQMNEVPLVPYATPGSATLAQAIIPYVRDHDAFLMANHGATTLGATLALAHQRMESLEHAARILCAARALGSPRNLTAQEVRELLASREGRE